MKKSLAAAVAVCALHIVSADAISGQPRIMREPRPFHGGVDVTSIPVTVRDVDGRLATDLTADRFQISEDGEPQTLTQFTSERVPIGLGMLIDTSDSMFGKRIQDARAAVDRFLLELLAPDDEFFVMAFNHQAHPLTTWTHDPAVVRDALDRLKPSGATALYDAVQAALPRIDARNRERAAIVIVSDGADTASDASLRQITMRLRDSDAFVYAIAIDPPDRQAINTRVNPPALAELTGGTGGRTLTVHSSDDLESATANIADELNHQYLLGYVSSHGADGKYHSIRVRITGTGYQVRARAGYVAPTRSENSPGK
jgi:Ca-activated chloride channel homolog